MLKHSSLIGFVTVIASNFSLILSELKLLCSATTKMQSVTLSFVVDGDASVYCFIVKLFEVCVLQRNSVHYLAFPLYNFIRFDNKINHIHFIRSITL